MIVADDHDPGPLSPPDPIAALGGVRAGRAAPSRAGLPAAPATKQLEPEDHSLSLSLSAFLPRTTRVQRRVRVRIFQAGAGPERATRTSVRIASLTQVRRPPP